MLITEYFQQNHKHIHLNKVMETFAPALAQVLDEIDDLLVDLPVK